MSSTKGKTLYLNKKSMDYVTFGKGKQPLVIIPGLGDGLQTVKGMAMPFSITYRILAKRYKIYVFSRINELRQGYTTRDMAADVAEAMEALNLDTSYVMGISQGGMIAQWLVVDFPEKVQKLILAVTTAKPSQLARERMLESELSIGKSLVNLELLSISCWISQSTPIRKRAIKSGGSFIISWVAWGESKMKIELPFSLSLALLTIALRS